MQNSEKDLFLDTLGKKLKTIRNNSGIESTTIEDAIGLNRVLQIEAGIDSEITLAEFVTLIDLYKADASMVIDSVKEEMVLWQIRH